MNYIIIDQGTSSTKGFLFNENGEIVYSNKIKYVLSRPKPFYVECNPIKILEDIIAIFKEMSSFSSSEKVISAGIAFQRSTFLFWDKLTCTPATPAISWQDSRAHSIINRFKESENDLWEITGTPLSAHFGGPKFIHMIENNKSLLNGIKNNTLFFGPLSAFITHSITGKPAVDESIACRTLMYNLEKGMWSKFATNLFNIPLTCLPPIKPTNFNYGKILNSNIELQAIIGDQQAALIGQNGLKRNTVGSNFGTSASIQYNTGKNEVKIHGLISSILYSEKNERIFMVEGTINACNALFKHLENELGISHEDMLWEKRVQHTTTNGIFIPGFNGISSPYWKTGLENIYVNLDSNPNQIIRAGMESIGFLFNDIVECFKDVGLIIPSLLTASGGVARPVLLQFISDLTNLSIGFSAIKDRTAIGVYKILSKKHSNQNDLHFSEIFNPQKIQNIQDKKRQWEKTLSDNKIKKRL